MTEAFFLKMAEYVGANEPFNPKKYISEYEDYIMLYPLLFRIWRYTIDEAREDIPLRNVDYLACTKSKKALVSLAEEGDHDPGSIITKHSGLGFEPLLILIEGLKQYPQTKERSFVQDVIRNNEWQKEVILLDVPARISFQDNVVGYWDMKDINFFKGE